MTSSEIPVLSALLLLLLTFTLGSSAEMCTGPVCTYHFHVHKIRTMTYLDRPSNVTYNVRMNGTRLQLVGSDFLIEQDPGIVGSDVSPNDVVTADGYQRNVIAINGMFPGPTIEIIEGAQLVVHVHNKLLAEVISVHFHGLPQDSNVWMDGVPLVTQCPIQPGQSFTYRMVATPAGTHWYHSHVVMQRLDGLFGFLIIHKGAPATPEVALSLQDWHHEDGDALTVTNPYLFPVRGTGDNYLHSSRRDYDTVAAELTSLGFVSALINGRGRWNDDKLPWSEIHLTRGRKHRFRLIHAGAEYPFEVSVDQHNLTVVATDGTDCKPVEVDFLVILPGESFDFEVTASHQSPDVWLRARTLTERIGSRYKFNWSSREVKAMLLFRDGGGSDSVEPTTEARQCSLVNPCKVFNCPFISYPTTWYRKCISLHEARSVHDVSETYGLQDDGEEVVEHFLNLAFTNGSSINGRKFVAPRVSLHVGGLNHIMPCQHSSADNFCSGASCHCTHVLRLPYNKTVQITLSSINQGTEIMAHHTMHLHGHTFAVLKMAYPPFGEVTHEDIRCQPTHCNDPHWKVVPTDLNLRDPPIKETAVVPAGGYTVIRFRTLNPGFWLLHCHQELHSLEGMDMIVAEAVGRLPPLPPKFPTCTNFEWSEQDFRAYQQDLRSRKAREAIQTEEGTTSHVPRVTLAGVGVGLSLCVPLLLLLVWLLRSQKRRTLETTECRYSQLNDGTARLNWQLDETARQRHQGPFTIGTDSPPEGAVRRRHLEKKERRKTM